MNRNLPVKFRQLLASARDYRQDDSGYSLRECAELAADHELPLWYTAMNPLAPKRQNSRIYS